MPASWLLFLMPYFNYPLVFFSFVTFWLLTMDMHTLPTQPECCGTASPWERCERRWCVMASPTPQGSIPTGRRGARGCFGCLGKTRFKLRGSGLAQRASQRWAVRSRWCWHGRPCHQTMSIASASSGCPPTGRLFWRPDGGSQDYTGNKAPHNIHHQASCSTPLLGISIPTWSVALSRGGCASGRGGAAGSVGGTCWTPRGSTIPTSHHPHLTTGELQ